MRKRKRMKLGIAALSVFLLLLIPRPVQAAITMQELAAMVGALNSSGELIAVHNGFLIDTGDGLAVVSAYNEEWEMAAEIAVVTINGSGKASVSINDAAAGVAVMSLSGNLTGCPVTAAASLLELSEGSPLIYGGVNLYAQTDDMSEALEFGEGRLAGFAEEDGYTFGLLAEELDPSYAGGAVYSEAGQLVGALSSRGAVLPIDYVMETLVPGAWGSAGGGTGSNEPGGSSGGGTGGGNSEPDGTGGGETGGNEPGGSSGGSEPGGSSGGSEPGGSFGEGGAGGSTGGGEAGGTASGGLSESVPALSVYFLVVFFGGLAAFAGSFIAYQNRQMKKKLHGEEEFSEMFRYMGGAASAGGPGSAGGVRAIEGMGGYFRGRRLELSGRPVILGRDPSRCTAVYPPDTKGISGFHCQVSLSGNEATLMDCGSTYGTYLADGRRLAPNTPCRLKSGDTFYLAEPQNTFRVI